MTSFDANDISFVIAILGLLSIIFSVYRYFRTPQEDLEKRQAVSDIELDAKASLLAQKEVENKANILAEQVKSKNDENERRFNEMGIRLDKSLETAQNHIHSVDVKVDNLVATVNSMGNAITKLSTIIDERIPRKE